MTCNKHNEVNKYKTMRVAGRGLLWLREAGTPGKNGTYLFYFDLRKTFREEKNRAIS